MAAVIAIEEAIAGDGEIWDMWQKGGAPEEESHELWRSMQVWEHCKGKLSKDDLLIKLLISPEQLKMMESVRRVAG
jgi:hypothetical protein